MAQRSTRRRKRRRKEGNWFFLGGGRQTSWLNQPHFTPRQIATPSNIPSPISPCHPHPFSPSFLAPRRRRVLSLSRFLCLSLSVSVSLTSFLLLFLLCSCLSWLIVLRVACHFPFWATALCSARFFLLAGVFADGAFLRVLPAATRPT